MTRTSDTPSSPTGSSPSDAVPSDRPCVSVDLDALARNYARLQAASGRAETAAVVKADAYGLGCAPVVRQLMSEGCRTFFVANMDEGAAARALAPAATIYVLNGLPPDGEALMDASRLSPVLNTADQIKAWARARRARPTARPGALFVDTGMNRLGLRGADLKAALATSEAAADDIDLVVSHFACANTPRHPMNAEQIARFADALATARTRFPNARGSLANSAGVFLGADACFDLTRPGIALYGGAPQEDGAIVMEPVVTLAAPIVQVRALQPGDRVGYGADHVVERPVLAATVALGYGDGFLRAGGGRGYGVLAGRRAAIMGRVSMDLMTVDVTAARDAARPGALVEFLGAHAALDDQADAAGTIGYELLVRLGPRCARRYVTAAPTSATEPSAGAGAGA